MSVFTCPSGLDIVLAEFMREHTVADQIAMTGSVTIWQAFLVANPGSVATKTGITRSLRRLGYVLQHHKIGTLVVGVRMKNDAGQ
jgi:hypothetical protein